VSDAVAYKVLTVGELEAWARSGAFGGSAADLRDGFVHLSTAGQLAGTLERHFAGVAGLVVAAVALDRLGAAVRWEAARGGALFPHVYGAVPYEAVVTVRPLARGLDGSVVLPERSSQATPRNNDPGQV
jgi:uncharacterized protein (DUF952 family)